MKQRILINDTHEVEMAEGQFESLIAWLNDNMNGTYDVRSLRRKVAWEAEDAARAKAMLDESIAMDRAIAAKAKQDSLDEQEKVLRERLAELKSGKGAVAKEAEDAAKDAEDKSAAAQKAAEKAASAKAKDIMAQVKPKK